MADETVTHSMKLTMFLWTEIRRTAARVAGTCKGMYKQIRAHMQSRYAVYLHTFVKDGVFCSWYKALQGNLGLRFNVIHDLLACILCVWIILLYVRVTERA